MSVVLMYHDIINDVNPVSGFQDSAAKQYKVTASDFEEQAQALSPEKAVFTFDDGGESGLTIAAPILEKYGHRGIFFIATDFIGAPGFLSAKQIKELESRGHIIGSHSCSHPENMSLLSEEAIAKEWTESIRQLEDILGHKVEYASIPNGYSSGVIIDEAQKTNIRYLYTSEPTTRVINKNGMLLIGRYVVHNSMNTQEVCNIVNSSTVRKTKLLKWYMIETVKLVLGKKYEKVKAFILR